MPETKLARLLKTKVKIFEKSLCPDLVTGLVFCILFSGFFFLDTFVHRLFLYILFPIGIFFIKENKNHDFNVLEIIKDPLVSLTLSFLAFTLFSILWSYNSSPELLWEKFKTAPFILMTGAIYISYLNKYPNSWISMLQIFTIVSILSGLYLLLIYHQDISYLFKHEENHIWRLEGIGRAKNSNLAGLLYSLSFIVLSFNNFKNSQLPRFLVFTTRTEYRIIGALITIVITFLTLSRGAIAACLLTFAAILFLKFIRNSDEIRKFLVPVIAGISLITLLGLCLPDILNYMIERGTTGRVDIWSNAISHYMDSPIWGHGIATPFKYDIVLGTFNHTHNVYLTVLSHTGLIGFGIFISLCFVALIRAHQSFQKENDAISFAFLFYGLVFGLVEFGGFYKSLGNEWLVFWLPISILIYKKQNEMKNREQNFGAINFRNP